MTLQEKIAEIIEEELKYYCNGRSLTVGSYKIGTERKLVDTATTLILNAVRENKEEVLKLLGEK